MAVKICEKCGESNPENATTCLSCGESLVNVKSIGVANDKKFVTQTPERCPNCDRSIVGEHSVCPHCGFNFSKKEDFVHYEIKSDYPKSNPNTGIYILSFLIPLAGIIIGAIWLSSDDKKEGGKTAMTWAIIGIVVGVVLSAIIL